MEETFRYRLFKLKDCYIEVWDKMEDQWEDFCELPEGECLITIKDKDIDDIRRLRKRYLQPMSIPVKKLAVWER